jgi:ABC-2 type transport system ATP-binding protein
MIAARPLFVREYRPLINAQNIHKAWGKIVAVSDLSLEIQRGELFGLLGPNGAGKSTTIGMLIGLVAPDRGSVEMNGRPPTDLATRSKIGFAPQNLSLYGELTGAENLEFFGALYGLAGKALRDRVKWALQLAGLEDRSRHRVSTYSGGMKRRLNIAVALIHKPEMLLLDEPTVGVDPQSRNHIFQWIEQLNREGLTILYTTHYMEEAQRLCQRVAIIDGGKLLALDTVDSLITKHGGGSLAQGTVDHVPSGVSLPGKLRGGQWRHETATPLEEITRLTQAGVRFQTVQITRPDLESVFLALTGKTLRD